MCASRAAIPSEWARSGKGALAKAHPARAATVDFDVDIPSAPLMVLGDDDLLHRAVFNLALNAVQASRPNERVRLVAAIATREQRFPRAAFPSHGAVAVQVIDEGPGIPTQVQDRLFEPLATTKTGDTGLGSRSYTAIDEAHRGVVLVDTNERGTRFTALLPRAESLDGATQ